MNNIIHDMKTQPLEKRITEAERIRKKYPNSVPVIVAKQPNSPVPDIEKKKYMVSEDLTFAQFSHTIRKSIKLKPEQAIFLYVGTELLPMTHKMRLIYDKHKDEDGFLYITYAGENVYGSQKIE